MEDCPICHKSLGDGETVRLGEKGCTGILNANTSNACPVEVNTGDFVHTQCRKDFTRPRNNSKTLTPIICSPPRVLRSVTEQFDFKSKCLFCASFAKCSLFSKKRSHDVYPVRSFDFQNKILKHCVERNDKWANDVNSRLIQVLDLPAAEAVYHQSCSVNFRTGKNVPKAFNTTDQGPVAKVMKSPGRPQAIDQAVAFKQIIKTIETCENATLTVNDLVMQMSEICGDNCYSSKHMKKKILDHFGESVIVSSIGGKNDIITLRQSVSSIVRAFYENSREVSEVEQKRKIIETAALLIKSDINNVVNTKDFYPSFTDISSTEKNIEFLPESLKTFLGKLFPEKCTVKTASIGQSIIQSCRPKGLLSPLQLGLGVQLHHHFGSRFLVDTLNSLGFCCSYSEVQKYESNAAAVLSTNIPCQETGIPFLQFVADNVDHNLRTLDGYNTFHGMGIIATSTPGTDVSVPVPRKAVSMDEVSSLGKVDIKYFVPPPFSPEGIQFQELPKMQKSHQYEPLDMLCKFVWPLRQSRPSWSGFMQMFEQPSEYFSKTSAITFMPMIDLNPSDATCIYSTLHFVCDQSKRYGKTPVLTFDQPLYQKAMDIICSQVPSSPLKMMVLRLGGFHTEMSFLGSIGHIMTSSGLQDVLETVYAPNAVTHMMSGKAVQRATRGHMLIDNALNVLLLENAFQLQNQTDSEQVHTLNFQQLPSAYDNEIGAKSELSEEMLQDVNLINLSKVYDSLVKENSTLQQVGECESLQTLSALIQTERKKLEKNRTARLWIQYMEMVSILQHFIRAERTGNWELHLITLRKMLPYFAASGHNLYLKSAHIYLQSMLRLPETNPDVYEAFMAGNHVIRRSDRYWAGLSTDLIIEQVLMRSVKSTGGLTRGRGMSENQRALWLFAMPICLQMNNAMQDFSNTSYQTSEQHKETGKSRITRDSQDMTVMLSFLRDRTPFNDIDTELRNIETGVVADTAVNVDQAEAVGEAVVKEMTGKSAGKFSFKRSRQVVTMSDKSDLKVFGEGIHIDTQLLFQRLTTAADRYVDDVSEVFKYELSSIPSSLFDNAGLPREPQKATLADALWKQGECAFIPDENTHTPSVYVIDGGSLLQRLQWVKGYTFGGICKSYSDYLRRQYGDNPLSVVFDGYEQGPSTKDVTHLRRSKGRSGAVVKFTIETPCRMKKDVFLSNPQNKQNFIFMLGECLMGEGFSVRHADNDADLMIVQTAVEMAETSNVTVVGEDTDLLVLLCYHYRNYLNNINFKSASRKSADIKGKIWDIRKATSLFGKDLCTVLPLLHAVTGCDTTSRIFGIGKPAVLKLFKKSPLFHQRCCNFLTADTLLDINRTGEQLITCLYDEQSSLNLDALRFQKFSGKVVSSSTFVQVQQLPPTSVAARFHCLRVYYQTKVWMGNTTLNPLDFGWIIVDGMMMPIKTSLPPAPENLLKIIRCNCKANCDSKKCTCRKHGLECSSGCGDCKGVSCSNSAALAELEEFVDDDV